MYGISPNPIKPLIRYGIFLFAIPLLVKPASGQNRKIDSLLSLIPTEKEDTIKVINEIKVCRYKGVVGDFALGKKYGEMAIALSQKLNYTRGLARALNELGNIEQYQGNYPKALELYQKALKLNEQVGSKQGAAACLSNLGVIYQLTSDYKNAEQYYLKALKQAEEIGNKETIGNNLGNLGGVYFENLHDYKKALEYFQRCLPIFKEMQFKDGLARTLENIGSVYLVTSEYSKALDYFNQSMQIANELNDKPMILDNQSNMAIALFNLGKYEEAVKSQKAGLALALAIGDKEHLKIAYGNMSTLDSARHDFKAAFEDHKLYSRYNDSIFNSDENQKVTRLHVQFEFDKKATADSIKALEEKKVISAELKQEQTRSYALYGGLALLLVFGGFMYSRYRVTQKQNGVIAGQKILVEEKNREILDSISYALRIQTAILPSQRLVKQYLDNSFILYKPKDIVAGDFYWMEAVNNIVLFAACDCTGHGVPGALVSVVCHNALNRAVREFGLTQPAAILDKTKEFISENFSKSEENIKDGMDISLCAYHPSTKTLEWAGANNPLWLLRNGEIQETKADKQPIGLSEDGKPFTNHRYVLQSGDCIYLFTDGFADQFGGEKGQKKLTRKRFKDLILSFRDIPVSEQGSALDKFITDYRKTVEQIDDILVIGVKIP